jgi:hypothetical protein
MGKFTMRLTSTDHHFSRRSVTGVLLNSIQVNVLIGCGNRVRKKALDLLPRDVTKPLGPDTLQLMVHALFEKYGLKRSNEEIKA